MKTPLSTASILDSKAETKDPQMADIDDRRVATKDRRIAPRMTAIPLSASFAMYRRLVQVWRFTAQPFSTFLILFSMTGSGRAVHAP
jgi:hypothetical protein